MSHECFAFDICFVFELRFFVFKSEWLVFELTSLLRCPTATGCLRFRLVGRCLLRYFIFCCFYEAEIKTPK